jgi:hypothetical protein
MRVLSMFTSEANMPAILWLLGVPLGRGPVATSRYLMSKKQ